MLVEADANVEDELGTVRRSAADLQLDCRRLVVSEEARPSAEPNGWGCRVPSPSAATAHIKRTDSAVESD